LGGASKATTMTLNQPSFVKSHPGQKRWKSRKTLIFNGFPFDTGGGESSAVRSLCWSIEPE
jgi:hypothetical protein